MRRKLSFVAVLLFVGLSVGCGSTSVLGELPPEFNASPQVRAGLRPLVEEHLGLLKTGQYTLLFYTLPERAQVRFVETKSFWGKIMGSAPMAVSLREDLMKLKDVMLGGLPLPGAKLPLYRMEGGRSVLVIYDMSCEEAGWLEPIPLRLTLRYAHNGEKWKLFGLRLKGPMFD